jgi:hypothetical protein
MAKPERHGIQIQRCDMSLWIAYRQAVHSSGRRSACRRIFAAAEARFRLFRPLSLFPKPLLRSFVARSFALCRPYAERIAATLVERMSTSRFFQ